MPSSSFLGNPGDRWPLSKAVDALADAARGAGVPGLIWIAGAFYPSLNLNVDLILSFLAVIEQVSGIDLPGGGDVGPVVMLFAPGNLSIEHGSLMGTIGLTLLFLPLILVIYRFIVGLAMVSDPRIWDAAKSFDESAGHVELESEELKRRTPRLRTVWRAGRGLGLTAFALWLMLLGLLMGALLVLVGPLVALVKVLGLSEFSAVFAGLIIPVLVLLLAYAVVLMVLNQLALHSLAHNRRGVASALTHAWRLVRASPMSALRATVVDFVLFMSIVLIAKLVGGALEHTPVISGFAPIFVFLLYGFAGVTRAGFWARTYRALGGLSATDQVPGL